MAQPHSHVVVVHHAEEGGYWIDVPALPGCYAQGETVDEALNEARDAIQAHLDALHADGQTTTHEDVWTVTIAVG